MQLFHFSLQSFAKSYYLLLICFIRAHFKRSETFYSTQLNQKNGTLVFIFIYVYPVFTVYLGIRMFSMHTNVCIVICYSATVGRNILEWSMTEEIFSIQYLYGTWSPSTYLCKLIKGSPETI